MLPGRATAIVALPRRACGFLPLCRTPEGLAHLARDLEVLARGDHERARRRTARADLRVAAGPRVGLRVELHAQEAESGRRARADPRRVLAHAAREDQRV